MKIRSYFWHRTEAQAIRYSQCNRNNDCAARETLDVPWETVERRSFYVCLQTDTPLHRYLPSTIRGHKKFPTTRNKHIMLSNVQINWGHNFCIYPMSVPVLPAMGCSVKSLSLQHAAFRLQQQTWTVAPYRPTMYTHSGSWTWSSHWV
jgi:hypothetical protein